MYIKSVSTDDIIKLIKKYKWPDGAERYQQLSQGRMFSIFK